MKKTYQIRNRDTKGTANAVARFAEANGQFLLPMVELVEQSRSAVEEVIQQISQQTIETVLRLSAEQVAGGRTPGKTKSEIRLHGSQPGCVKLADRNLPVKRPRLRRKQGGEAPVPAYEAMRKNPAQAARMLGTVLHGVSTREYKQVLPKAAEAVGVSRSAVSRQVIEASEKKLQELAERRWDGTEILILYIDGQRFGEHHILSAVGVDVAGKKHILGIEYGATENAAAVTRLLVHLRDHGLSTERKYLFVIDGSQALRRGIDEVFGQHNPVQRCRNHKMKNVLDELPEEQQPQVVSVMRVAFKVGKAEEGEKRLEGLARMLESNHPTAAASLREGMPEMFTLQRLQIPPSLHKCLATTNIIESPQSGVRKRTRNVTRWRNSDMVQRWAASAWLHTEKKFRKLDGHQDLWTLAVLLGRESAKEQRGHLAKKKNAA